METLVKILPADLAGKLHVGQPDSPTLGTLEMQTLMDAHANTIDAKFNALVDAQNSNNADLLAGINGGGNVTPEQVAYWNAKANGINLLINGDFSNPVNQRAQNSYSVTNAGVYSADRWILVNGNGTSSLTINSGYTTLSASGDWGGAIDQRFETKIEPGVYVVSIALLSGLVLTGVLNWDGHTNSMAWMDGESFQAIILNDNAHNTFRVLLLNRSADIKYVKLEIGDHATPFTPRLPGKELALCQRYGLLLSSSLKIRASVITANTIDFLVPTPVTLRQTPLINGANWAVSTISDSPQTGFTVSAVSLVGAGVLMRATKTSHGLTDAYLHCTSNSEVFDSEIY